MISVKIQFYINNFSLPPISVMKLISVTVNKYITVVLA